MTAKHLIEHLEHFAPPGAAWKNDNIGLQIGFQNRSVKNILIALELNTAVFESAVKNKCDFIFTHHPFIFNSLNKLDFDRDEKAFLIKKLIEKNVTVYSAHTNFDFTKEGVSFQLARKLGLKNISFLVNQNENQNKLVVFVPDEYLDVVSHAIFEAGGGVIGEYSHCSFGAPGTGSFKGSNTTSPAVGKKLNLEFVDEMRLEVLVDKWNLGNVISAMLKAHPYEEPAYDVYPLLNKNINYGEGAIGELETPMKVNAFLKHTADKLNAAGLKYCKGKSRNIKKVAVCGGSGSSLVKSAIAAQADALITADVKYHSFQEIEGKILFIDAGHYETEVHSLDIIKKKITAFAKQQGADIKVFKYAGSTNPIKFFHNVGVK